MKRTVNRQDFHQAFKDCGRMDQFSPEGLDALFDYLEEDEESSGIELELDVIRLCCDFAEYETLAAFQQDYGEDYDSIEKIAEHTSVVCVGDERLLINRCGKIPKF